MYKLYWIYALFHAISQKSQSIVSINNQIFKSLTLLI